MMLRYNGKVMDTLVKICPSCGATKEIYGGRYRCIACTRKTNKSRRGRPQSKQAKSAYDKRYAKANHTDIIEYMKSYRPRYNRTIKTRYSVMKCKAKKLGRPFDLTLDQYAVLVSCSCHYCGGTLPETGIGLDRIDSKRGYTLDNVMPCCKRCNEMKMSATVGEFISHIKKILAYTGDKQ